MNNIFVLSNFLDLLALVREANKSFRALVSMVSGPTLLFSDKGARWPRPRNAWSPHPDRMTGY